MIEVQGHRGARGRFPENTITAFLYALEAGADVLELDVAITKDKAVLIAHDPFLNPEICRDPSGKKIGEQIPIYSLTLAQAQKFDCGSLPNKRFPQQKQVEGEKMPALAELFAAVAQSKHPNARKIWFNVEIKAVPAGAGIIHPDVEEFAKLVVGVVKEYKLEKRVIIQSFDHKALVAVKKIAPKIKLSALFSDNHVDYVLVAKKIGANYISPNMFWITKDDVKALHKAKILISPWTVNETKDWDRMIELGVDSIISDYPEELLAYLRKKKLR